MIKGTATILNAMRKLEEIPDNAGEYIQKKIKEFESTIKNIYTEISELKKLVSDLQVELRDGLISKSATVSKKKKIKTEDDAESTTDLTDTSK